MTKKQADWISFLAVGLLIVVANLVETICILRKKSKNTFEKLLLSLALSDLLVGITTIVYNTIGYVGYVSGQKPRLHEGLAAIVFMFSSIFSLENLLAITIDRFLAIRFPIKHRVLVTPRRTTILIIFIWVSACLFGGGINLILVLGVPSGDEYVVTISSIGIISIGTIINIFYFCITKFLFTRQVTVTARPEDGKVLQRIQELFRGPQKTERAVLLSSVIVTATFIICMFPFAIEYLIFRDAKALTLASKMLLLLNSLLNPFVYFFNNFLRRSWTKPQ